MPDFGLVFDELKESNYTQYLAEELKSTVYENEEYRDFFADFPQGFADQVATELPEAFLREGP